jgi:hypothetical protein
VGEGGERGIRTPGSLTFNGFQDRRNRPLCHLSGRKIRVWGIMAKYNCRFLYDSLSVNLLPWIESLFSATNIPFLINRKKLLRNQKQS